jgi:predicted dehydrogenase
VSNADQHGQIIRAGVIGLGFMGATHARAYQSAATAGAGCTLAAVADKNPERLTGRVNAAGNLDTGASGERLFDPALVTGYATPDELLADDSIDLVSICTHTDSHVPIALDALRAGKHVLVEKPVALTSRDVRELAEAAYRSGRLCMPAMCMRFWPGWAWLKRAIDERTYGPVRSAFFERLGSLPDWGGGFYADTTRSGGALMDLHIHDADFVHWCFGPPDEVVCAGSPMRVTALYRYSRGPAHVVAQGGQDCSPGFPFRMRYLVAFESATADFDIARASPLLLHASGRSEPVTLEPLSGYDAQVRHLVGAIRSGKRIDQLAATIDDALAVTRMLEAELESCRTGRAVTVG